MAQEILVGCLSPKDMDVSSTQEAHVGDFPGGPGVKNPPSNAGDAGLIPGWGTKVPHAVGQLGLCATTTEHTGHN